MSCVNLTGNTASGQHGNKRQIDIRGMGPENTLILIDGRPVTSRNSTRMSWRGERTPLVTAIGYRQQKFNQLKLFADRLPHAMVLVQLAV